MAFIDPPFPDRPYVRHISVTLINSSIKCDFNTYCVHFETDESPKKQIGRKKADIRTLSSANKCNSMLNILICIDSCNYMQVPASEVTTAPVKELRGQQSADLGGEGKLGGFGFAWSVDGC